MIRYLLICLFSYSTVLSAQCYIVGEKLDKVDTLYIKYQKTQAINKPYIEFYEDLYQIKFSKEDIIQLLEHLLSEQKTNVGNISIYQYALQYIQTNNELIFRYNWEETYTDISNLKSEREITKKLLSELVCTLIEQGKFQLTVENKTIEYYYFNRLSCANSSKRYGITKSNIIFWICPPFYID